MAYKKTKIPPFWNGIKRNLTLKTELGLIIPYKNLGLLEGLLRNDKLYRNNSDRIKTKRLRHIFVMRISLTFGFSNYIFKF